MISFFRSLPRDVKWRIALCAVPVYVAVHVLVVICFGVGW